MKILINAALLSLMLALLPACQTTPEAEEAAADESEGDWIFGQSRLKGDALAAAIAKADQHPLGSAENPVRVFMPGGERDYLSRLRCSDGKVPQFQRMGSVGVSVFGNIADVYEVVCAGAEPAQSEIFMDMYHGDHVETRAVPGFRLVPVDATELQT
jgi:hypothetical protein